MLFVTTCCIYKSTSYINLSNNCKEKSTFPTRPRVLKDQISQEILVGIVIFLCLSKIYLHLIQTPLQKPGRNSLHLILNISYFSHFISNISGQQCMGLEAALAWETCTFGLTNSSFTKITIELYHDLRKLFYSKRTEITVEI